MTRRPVLACIALLPACLLLATTTFAAGAADERGKASDWVLQSKFMPVTPAQAALKDAPFSPGAAAVVLFSGVQVDWAGDIARSTFHRRVKVLTQAGVEDWSDHSETFYGTWRIQETAARTILPDGTIVDAKDQIHVEGSDTKKRDRDEKVLVVRVTFPRVQPGAILDSYITLNTDSVPSVEWEIQEDLPVLETRFVMAPPNGLRFRIAPLRIPEGKLVHREFRLAESYAHGFSVRDVPPIPDLPNMPPDDDVAMRLLVVFGQAQNTEAAEWRRVARSLDDHWQGWIRKPDGKVKALAAEIAGGAATPRAKADAIRVALRDRMTVEWLSLWPAHDSPDEALAAGSGTSADLAGLTFAMLRAAGVDAALAAYRPRSMGMVPPNQPVISLYEDYLVSFVDEGGKDAWMAPGSALPAGSLPFDASGILAVRVGKDTEGPIAVPDVPSAANKSRHVVQATIEESGTLKAESTSTFSGAAAEAWRDSLRAASAEERRAAVERLVRRAGASAQLAAHAVEGLDASAPEVSVIASWSVEGYASRAGSRLLVPPFVFTPVDASDWAAETRDVDVELGAAREIEETVLLQFPAGVTEVKLPQTQSMDAGPAGKYEVTYGGKGRALNAVRKLRIGQHAFPASTWPDLRKWHLDMAEADEQPIVLTFGP